MLASMPSTKLLLRVDEPETAAFIARQIGDREALRDEIRRKHWPSTAIASVPILHAEPSHSGDGLRDSTPTAARRLSLHRWLDRARVKMKPSLGGTAAVRVPSVRPSEQVNP